MRSPQRLQPLCKGKMEAMQNGKIAKLNGANAEAQPMQDTSLRVKFSLSPHLNLQGHCRTAL